MDLSCLLCPCTNAGESRIIIIVRFSAIYAEKISKYTVNYRMSQTFGTRFGNSMVLFSMDLYA